MLCLCIKWILESYCVFILYLFITNDCFHKPYNVFYIQLPCVYPHYMCGSAPHGWQKKYFVRYKLTMTAYLLNAALVAPVTCLYSFQYASAISFSSVTPLQIPYIVQVLVWEIPSIIFLLKLTLIDYNDILHVPKHLFHSYILQITEYTRQTYLNF